MVPVQYSGCNCFVWTAEAVRVLREEYRIVGTLIGCLPRAPRQNVHLGLPQQLMPEETTLLLEKGLIELQETVYEKPTPEELAAYDQIKYENYQQQTALFQEDRRADIKRNLPQIIEGKRAKRNKLLEERRKKGEEIDDAEFDKEIEIDPDSIEIPALKPQFALVQLNLESLPRKTLTCRTVDLKFPQTDEEKLRMNHIQSISQTTDPFLLGVREESLPRKTLTCQAVDWKFPQTDQEKLRYAVFKDMWERGHYLTAAAKFGGDFLVYPGDPSRFHSIFIVVCQPHNEPLTALDMISMGRLGSNVKKTVVLCSMDDNNKLCYTSIQWTGIS